MAVTRALRFSDHVTKRSGGSEDENEPNSADPNACAVCFCLGYSGPFVSDASPKSIDREGLGESRTGTRQE